VTVRASNFNRHQQPSTNRVQQVQYQSLKNLKFQQSSLGRCSMKSKFRFLVLLMPILVCMAHSQTPKGQSSGATRIHQKLTVPEPVAHLIRPLLDLRQKSQQQPEVNCSADSDPTKCTDSNEENFEKLLAKLTARRDPSSDEALVVLMCFYL